MMHSAKTQVFLLRRGVQSRKCFVLHLLTGVAGHCGGAGVEGGRVEVDLTDDRYGQVARHTYLGKAEVYS